MEAINGVKVGNKLTNVFWNKKEVQHEYQFSATLFTILI